jgi:hypothetical protein
MKQEKKIIKKTKGKLGHDRFKELVHYVCSQCSEAPEKLGATKLNKTLWYVDTIAYCKYGKSISGEIAYIKRDLGPVPKRILPILRKLVTEKKLIVNTVDYFGYSKRDYITLKQADSTIFSDEEQQLINKIVKLVCDEHTAGSISELSHDLIWKAAELGEEIPIYAVLASTSGNIKKKHLNWADKVIEARIERSKSQKKVPKQHKAA